MLSARPCLARAKFSRCLGSAKKLFEENFSLVQLAFLRGHIFANILLSFLYSDSNYVLFVFRR
ncbi:MAG: hypothetical protein A3C63_01465 [Candidatus Zambryskibacteria bacterium RIFCSPHIGHO2_02_FULL_39_82]|nr:MAG: hypothetical protein A3C63_01465 [Candidatus Zambryskibacteria bacterium RIFCSPHIGHO2_02_FULL_39_82]